MGRKIFGLLTLMAVISVFVKVSFLNGHVEVVGKGKDSGFLIIQTFKEDWAMAQRALPEIHTSMPKRVLEKVSVSKINIQSTFSFLFLFLGPPINEETEASIFGINLSNQTRKELSVSFQNRVLNSDRV